MPIENLRIIILKGRSLWQKQEEKQRLRNVSYGCGGMGNAIVLAIVSTFLMFFYTDVIGLNAGIIGTIILVSKVFDGISDLVMGVIVDRTDSKYGKAKCWLLWLCVPYAVSRVILFLLSPTWPAVIQYIYIFMRLCSGLPMEKAMIICQSCHALYHPKSSASIPIPC